MRQLADYIGRDAIEEILAVFKYGDEKHPGDEWKRQPTSSHLRHAIAHISEYVDGGTDYDPETVRLHLAHAACRVLFAVSLELTAQAVIHPDVHDKNREDV